MDGKDGDKKVCTSNKRDTYQKAIEYHQNFWKLQKKSVIGPEKDEPLEVSGILTTHWVSIKKPLSTMKNFRKLRKKSVIGPEKEEAMEI